MPVYFSKTRRSITPPSFSEFPEDDDDYHRDPDEFWDLLPQPFRTVNKIVSSLLEGVWGIIDEKENEKEAELARNLSSVADGAETVPDLMNVMCLASSPDDRYVFAGLKTGLAVLETGTMSLIDKWEIKNKEVVCLQVVLLDTDLYLVAELDDMGMARLLAFYGERLYLIKELNDKDGDKKLLAQDFKISPCANYIGIGLENSAKDSWLEIHKIPRDSWLKEVESGASSKHSTSRSKASVESRHNEGQSSETTRSSAESSDADRIGYKFTPLTLILKCKPPQTVTGTNSSTFQQLFKSLDNDEVVGSGANHIISQGHLYQRDLIFRRIHENMLQYLPKEKEQKAKLQASRSTFHFLSNGRLPPLLMEANSGASSSILVWWSEDHRASLFSLLKANQKDVEYKAELIWTFSSSINCSCTSPCLSVIAFGLISGNVVVFDKENGLFRRSIQVSGSPITRLDILPPAPNQNYSGCRVLVVDRDLEFYLLEDNKLAVTVPTSVKHLSEKVQWVEHISSHPDLVLRISRNGQATIHDVTRLTEVCRLILPDQFTISLPWQPVWLAGNKGSILFIKGSTETFNEETEETETQEQLFYYQLKNIPELISYWSRQYTSTQAFISLRSAEDQVKSILASRFSTHMSRYAALNSRWSKLKDTFKLIEQKKLDSLAKTSNFVTFE